MLSEFLNNNKEEIDKLNNGDDKVFLKKEKEKFISGNKLKEEIIKVNYIEQFNDFINQKTDIEKVVLTIRDGLYLIRKL